MDTSTGKRPSMKIPMLMYEGSGNHVFGRNVLRCGTSALAAGFALTVGRVGAVWWLCSKLSPK